MRIKLTLLPLNKCVIPINYQYHLSSSIYKIISNENPDYSKWLHDNGYLDTSNKPRKLFVFSNLYIIPRPKLFKNYIIIQPNSIITLFVSSIIINDFINNFVNGIFKDQEIEIYDNMVKSKFLIQKVETLKEITFSSKMKYYCISPILLSTLKNHNGELSQYYYRPDDIQLCEAIKNNLLKKYELIYKSKIEPDLFKFNFDYRYINKKGGFNKITKLITITKNNNEIKVKGFFAPFTLETNCELHKIAYELGIGEKNSIGFGMIEESTIFKNIFKEF